MYSDKEKILKNPEKRKKISYIQDKNKKIIADLFSETVWLNVME